VCWPASEPPGFRERSGICTRFSVHLTTVGELMGHKGHQMTLCYAHLAPEHKQAAVDTLVPVGTVNA
jgi:hypothetical protein